MIHAVKPQTASGDVVLCQELFVAKMVNTVAPRDTPVTSQPEHVHKNLKLLKSL
jgi:hypothetical protein